MKVDWLFRQSRPWAIAALLAGSNAEEDVGEDQGVPAQNPFLTATPKYFLRRLKSRFSPTQFLSQSIHSTIERGLT